jgi:hypothetical protein
VLADLIREIPGWVRPGMGERPDANFGGVKGRSEELPRRRAMFGSLAQFEKDVEFVQGICERGIRQLRGHVAVSVLAKHFNSRRDAAEWYFRTAP